MNSRETRAHRAPRASEPTEVHHDDHRIAVALEDEHRDYRLVCAAILLISKGRIGFTFTVRDLEPILWREGGRLLDVHQNLSASLTHLGGRHGENSLMKRGTTDEKALWELRSVERLARVGRCFSVAQARTRLREATADLPYYREAKFYRDHVEIPLAEVRKTEPEPTDADEILFDL